MTLRVALMWTNSMIGKWNMTLRVLQMKRISCFVHTFNLLYKSSMTSPLVKKSAANEFQD